MCKTDLVSIGVYFWQNLTEHKNQEGRHHHLYKKSYRNKTEKNIIQTREQSVANDTEQKYDTNIYGIVGY